MIFRNAEVARTLAPIVFITWYFPKKSKDNCTTAVGTSLFSIEFILTIEAEGSYFAYRGPGVSRIKSLSPLASRVRCDEI